MIRTGTLLPLVLSALAVAATVLRLPDVLVEPRFWAEEARVYFLHALTAPTWDALSAPHQGYYSLVPNFATWLATLVPLERAPVVTTWIALAVQVLPAIVTATGSGTWVDTPMKRTVAVMAVLLVGATGELHATTICSQFHMAVLGAAIYLDTDRSPTGGRVTTLVFLLLVAGLTGVQAILLTPLFAWRWLQERRRSDAAATAVLGACLVLQIIVIATVPVEGDRFALGGDAAGVLLNTAENLVKGLILYPIAGDIGPKTLSQPLGPLLFAIGAVGVASAVVVQAAILRRGPSRPLLAAAWFVALVSFAASRRMAGGERYLEVSSVLIVLAIAGLAADKQRHRALRMTAGVAVAAALISNAWLYLPRLSGVYDPSWPVWREEIARWRAGDIDAPRLHPQWGDAVWTVRLPEAAR